MSSLDLGQSFWDSAFATKVPAFREYSPNASPWDYILTITARLSMHLQR